MLSYRPIKQGGNLLAKLNFIDQITAPKLDEPEIILLRNLP